MATERNGQAKLLKISFLRAARMHDDQWCVPMFLFTENSMQFEEVGLLKIKTGLKVNTGKFLIWK